jgi:hypothetical protein
MSHPITQAYSRTFTRPAHVLVASLQPPLTSSHRVKRPGQSGICYSDTHITRQPLCPDPNGSIPSSQAISNLLLECVSHRCRTESTRSRSHRLCQPWPRKHDYSRPVQSTDSYKRRARNQRQLTKRDESALCSDCKFLEIPKYAYT